MGNMTALRRSYTIWFNGLPIDEIDSITKSYALRVMMAIPYEYQWQEASLQALEGLNNPIRDAQVLLQLRQVKLDQFSLCLMKAFLFAGHFSPLQLFPSLARSVHLHSWCCSARCPGSVMSVAMNQDIEAATVSSSLGPFWLCFLVLSSSFLDNPQTCDAALLLN